MKTTFKNCLIAMLVLILVLIIFNSIFIWRGYFFVSPISRIPIIEGTSWERKWGGIFFDSSTSLDIDNNGDIYLAGKFVSFADFNPGWGVNLRTVRGTGFYIGKFTSDGVNDWTRISDLSCRNTDFVGVIIGDDSRIYVGNECSNIEAYNLDGDQIHDSPMNAIIGSPVGFDDDGYLYVTNDNSIIKINNEGNELWEFDHVNGSNTITFDSDGSLYLASDNLIKLDPEGNEIWSVNTDGWVTGIDVDDSDFIYITGVSSLGENVSISPIYRNVVYRRYDTSFIAKYDIEGNLNWVKEWKSVAYDIAVSGNGDVYVTGGFSHPSDFDPGLDEVVRYHHEEGTTAIFLSKFNSDGIFEWVRVGREPLSYGLCIGIDDSENIYLGGMTRGDAFIAKFTPDSE